MQSDTIASSGSNNAAAAAATRKERTHLLVKTINICDHGVVEASAVTGRCKGTRNGQADFARATNKNGACMHGFVGGAVHSMIES
jgi:hypothetical protein